MLTSSAMCFYSRNTQITRKDGKMAENNRRKSRDTLSISVPTKLKETIGKLAWDDNRSISNFVVRILTAELEKNHNVKREDIS